MMKQNHNILLFLYISIDYIDCQQSNGSAATTQFPIINDDDQCPLWRVFNPTTQLCECYNSPHINDISKLLKRHMYWVIAKHLEVHSPISIHQWGFQPKKSTTAALLNVYNDWSAALDKGKEVCAIFFDLRKAFDSVPHRCLMDKLTFAGLNPYILRWVASYLCNRRQYVVLNGKESSIIDVVSGVPQGSVLGPLLFLLYINESVQEPLSDGTPISLYADDILMYRIINCVQDYKMLQSDIDTVSRWVDINELALNHIKCKYMVVSRLKSRAVPSPTMLLYGLVNQWNGLPTTSILEFSLLRSCPGLFTSRRFHVKPGGWLGCYTDLIRPHLEYAVPVWNPYLVKDIQKLESIQRFALKVCLKSWDGSYSDHLQACNLPHLVDRRKMLCLMYLYKAVNGYVVNLTVLQLNIVFVITTLALAARMFMSNHMLIQIFTFTPFIHQRCHSGTHSHYPLSPHHLYSHSNVA